MDNVSDYEEDSCTSGTALESQVGSSDIPSPDTTDSDIEKNLTQTSSNLASDETASRSIDNWTQTCTSPVSVRDVFLTQISRLLVPNESATKTRESWTRTPIFQTPGGTGSESNISLLMPTRTDPVETASDENINVSEVSSPMVPEVEPISSETFTPMTTDEMDLERKLAMNISGQEVLDNVSENPYNSNRIFSPMVCDEFENKPGSTLSSRPVDQNESGLVNKTSTAQISNNVTANEISSEKNLGLFHSSRSFDNDSVLENEFDSPQKTDAEISTACASEIKVDSPRISRPILVDESVSRTDKNLASQYNSSLPKSSKVSSRYQVTAEQNVTRMEQIDLPSHNKDIKSPVDFNRPTSKLSQDQKYIATNSEDSPVDAKGPISNLFQNEKWKTTTNPENPNRSYIKANSHQTSGSLVRMRRNLGNLRHTSRRQRMRFHRPATSNPSGFNSSLVTFSWQSYPLTNRNTRQSFIYNLRKSPMFRNLFHELFPQTNIDEFMNDCLFPWRFSYDQRSSEVMDVIRLIILQIIIMISCEYIWASISFIYFILIIFIVVILI